MVVEFDWSYGKPASDLTMQIECSGKLENWKGINNPFCKLLWVFFFLNNICIYCSCQKLLCAEVWEGIVIVVLIITYYALYLGLGVSFTIKFLHLMDWVGFYSTSPSPSLWKYHHGWAICMSLRISKMGSVSISGFSCSINYLWVTQCLCSNYNSVIKRW